MATFDVRKLNGCLYAFPSPARALIVGETVLEDSVSAEDAKAAIIAAAATAELTIQQWMDELKPVFNNLDIAYLTP